VSADQADSRPRVIVRVSRDLEVAGYVELEDADVIVLRTPTRKLESFIKSRIVGIVRLVDPAPGQSGTAYLRNGQTRSGVVIEDGFDQVVLEIEGIRARLARTEVQEVVLEPTFEERYAQYKASLGPHMHDQHMELCRWLVSQRRYELARQELEALLAQAPLPDARRLLEIVLAQIDLQSRSRLRSTIREEPRADDPHPEPALPSRDDVNIIRVYEIDPQRPPRVSVDPETIHALIDRYGSSDLFPSSPEERTALFRADPAVVVRLMLQLRATDLYPQIQVLTEPYSLNLFRRRVHDAWLIPGCATSRCHGGPEPGRFFLYRRDHKDPRVRYANLLILERLDLDPEWPLIDYHDPMSSLVIQHALPREAARKPHPDVRGWAPLLGRGRERLLRQTIAWIESMARPRPIYPVGFVPAPPRPPVPASTGPAEEAQEECRQLKSAPSTTAAGSKSPVGSP
jgi:hypothetical protein